MHSDVLLDLTWYAWLLWGSTGWFYFQVFLLKLFDLFRFYIIYPFYILDLSISIYNLSSYTSVIAVLSCI